jgi:uncharacterized protein YeaO (DUF488 family)
MTSKLDVRVRRVYDDPSPAEGMRVLVDASGRAASPERRQGLTNGRRWWLHPPSCGAGTGMIRASSRSFAAATEPNCRAWRQVAVCHLRELARSGPLTLLTATKDINHSLVAVLVEHCAAGERH